MARKRSVDGGSVAGPTEQKILDFAEDLGRVLGTAERKAQDRLNRRQDVVKQLTALRERADSLLSRLGGGLPAAIKRRGRPPALPPGPALAAEAAEAGRKRSKLSARARKAIADAQRKRWAAYKAAKAAKK